MISIDSDRIFSLENYHIEKCSISNQSEMEKWDDFVNAHPRATPFHLSCWLHTIHESYQFNPLLYALINEKGEISGVFPFFKVKGLFNGKQIVSLPFSDICGPLVNYHQEKIVFKKIIDENLKTVRCIEIRGPLYNADDFYRDDSYLHHSIRLSEDPAEVKKNFNKRTVLYSIRKAIKAGVAIREENSLFGIQEFYRLHLLTRKKHGVPAPPFEFFKKMFEHMISKGFGFISLAEWNSKIIAAAVFFKFRESLYYKYNASDPQYIAQKTPNHLLTWHAIEQACLKGYQIFDFGRASVANSGLIRYKEMWGAHRENLSYYYYPKYNSFSIRENSFLYTLFTKIWRLAPDLVAEKLGSQIYKYLL